MAGSAETGDGSAVPQFWTFCKSHLRPAAGAPETVPRRYMRLQTSPAPHEELRRR